MFYKTEGRREGDGRTKVREATDGIRTHYPYRAHWQTKLKESEKPAKQEHHAVTPISFLKWIVKLQNEKGCPCPSRKGDLLIPRDGEVGGEKYLQINLVKLTLIF